MPKTLEQEAKKKTRELIRIYEASKKEIQAKLELATKKGNDATYLKEVQKSIEDELKILRRRVHTWTQKKIPGLYMQAAQNQDEIIKKVAGELPPPQAGFGKVHKEAVATLAANTYSPIAQVSEIIGRNSLDYLKRVEYIHNEKVATQFLRKAGVENVKGAVVGYDTYRDAQRKIQATLNSKDVFKVPYYNKSGKVIKEVDAKVYSAMVARTTTAEAHRAGTKNRIQEYDYDLVEVIGRSIFPNSPCIPFEGRTLSLSGKTKGFVSLAEAKSQGLYHPNCVHDYSFSEKNLEDEPKDDTVQEVDEELEFKRSYNYLAQNSKKFNKSLKEYSEMGRDIVISKEKDAIIYHYTTNRIYKKLNEALRGQRKLTPGLLHFEKVLNHSLDKLPSYKGSTFRYQSALNNIDQFKVGKTVNFGQFLSTSTNLEAIGYFEDKFLFNIASKKGKKIKDVSMVQLEDEVLFKSHSNFKVTRVINFKEDNKIFIDLEEIG